jgi:RHS repeat-associated protein
VTDDAGRPHRKRGLRDDGALAASGVSTLFRYTGEQFDAENGLTYLRARYLNPGLGRFTGADTVQPNAPGSQGYNLYAYTAGNPTTWVDPSGHSVAGLQSLAANVIAYGIGAVALLECPLIGLAPCVLPVAVGVLVCAFTPGCISDAVGWSKIISDLGSDFEDGIGWGWQNVEQAVGDFPYVPTGPCPLVDPRYPVCVAAGYLPAACVEQFPWSNLAGRCLSRQFMITCNLFPFQCTLVLGLGKIAADTGYALFPGHGEGAVAEGGNPGNDDRGDFFEHCYWNGLITVWLNSSIAELFTTRYEATQGNPANERQYDMTSNERGRIFGDSVRGMGPVAASGALVGLCSGG